MAFCSRFVASGLTAFLIFGCSDWAESTRQDNRIVVQETNVARLLTQNSAKQLEDLFVQGNKFLETNRYEDAIAAYDKVVMAAPDNAEAWINRGNALAALQRYGQAL
ncbi:MAG: tetratricopeptide repeat protein, partial [Cyanobacteria bacterium J06573_2]